MYIYIYICPYICPYICVYWLISVFTCTLYAGLVVVAVVGTEPGCASMSGPKVDTTGKKKETTRQRSYFDAVALPCDCILYPCCKSEVDPAYENDPLVHLGFSVVKHCPCALLVAMPWVYADAAKSRVTEIKETGLDVNVCICCSHTIGKDDDDQLWCKVFMVVCLGMTFLSSCLCCNPCTLRTQILEKATADAKNTEWDQRCCLWYIPCKPCNEYVYKFDIEGTSNACKHLKSCFVVCCCTDVNLLQLCYVNRGAQDEPAAPVGERARLVLPPGVITLEL